MPKKQAPGEKEKTFRKNCKFALSLRYELFFSLNTLLDPQARIHPGWRKDSLAKLGKEFSHSASGMGKAWEVWTVIPSLLPGELAEPTFTEIVTALREMPVDEFAAKILRGLLHDEEVLPSLLKGKMSLRTALGRVPLGKREWLIHLGLFPYDPESPQVRALEILLADREKFRTQLISMLETYWQRVFQETWLQLEAQLTRSLEARERLFVSCSFAEFAKETLLRIEVNEGKAELKAIRGGYRLRMDQVERCYLVPSAFNDRRFWSAFNDESDALTVYFPYFDPSITLDPTGQARTDSYVEPAIDPALIFRALGDSTRFAIAAYIARQPATSVEIAKLLAVSKPTVSHHVHLLREAGLIRETFVGGAVQLELKRSVIERLSEMTVAKFFASSEPLQVKRSRSGTSQ